MNIFDDKTKEMPRQFVEEKFSPSTPPYVVSEYKREVPARDTPVRTMMVPEDQRALREASWGRYDAMDVKNVTRPRRGHAY